MLSVDGKSFDKNLLRSEEVNAQVSKFASLPVLLCLV